MISSFAGPERSTRWAETGGICIRLVSFLMFFAGAMISGAKIAHAHHSVTANFDRNSASTITGTVTVFHIRNPHSQLEVDVAEQGGTVSHWLVEWGSKNDLIRRGVDVNRIKVGDEVTINLILSRRLEHVGYLRSAILPDGSTIMDCGYAVFRDALIKGAELKCEDPNR